MYAIATRFSKDARAKALMQVYDRDYTMTRTYDGACPLGICLGERSAPEAYQVADALADPEADDWNAIEQEAHEFIEDWDGMKIPAIALAEALGV